MTPSAYHLLRSLCLALLTMVGSPLYAQSDAALTKRTTDLRETPADSARKTEALPAGAPLTHLGARQGPWVQVRTAQGRTGWLHMFDVGAAGGASQGSGTASSLRSLGTILNRGTENSTVTATSTVGIRGLGEEDIARAQPNLRGVAQMERLRVDTGTAQQFARGAALTARGVGDLPSPGPFSTPADGGE